MQEIQRMQKEGPTEDLANRAKETRAPRARDRHEAERLLAQPAAGGEAARARPDRCILEREERIDVGHAANVQEMFVKYFPMDRYTVVTLVPEK